MRDTSVWTGSPYTSKPYVALTVRQRHPNFRWCDGNTTYVLSGLGEDWGDSPGTAIMMRERDLPAHRHYGGFQVASDSVTLSGGNILRVTSLAAGNLGPDAWYKRVAGVSDLRSRETLTFATPPRPWTGIGLGRHSSTPDAARLFFIRSSDGKMMYRDYSVATGFGGTYQYTNSPILAYDGVAIAPISHDEGFVISYNPTSCVVTLYRFSAGAWTAAAMPMRYSQHPLNCHWFDAVEMGTDRLITFNVNGVQHATLWGPGTGFRDPWPVLAFDPEYGGAQTRICKLTKVGSRIVATAWSRYAGSSDDYEVSYYHLLWSDNGVHWAIPEEGYIGQVSCRGKLHIIDATAYVIGTHVSYVGDAVTWLGGAAGVQTTLGSNVVGHNLVQDLDRATDAKLPLLVPDTFDKSLLTNGAELVYGIGLVGEPAISIATLTMDTPGQALESNSQNMEIVARGPLKRLISAQAPMDQTYSGPESYHADFTVGSLYARTGVWGHEVMGVAYCERHDDSDAVTTVGMQYSGQFQISARVRITNAMDGACGGVVFWYEGPKDYHRVQLSSTSVSLRRIEAGVETVLVTQSMSLAADTWCDMLVRYAGATLTVWVRPSGGSWSSSMTFSAWTIPEPLRWYAGLFCILPSTKITQELSQDATHAVDVKSTNGFPAAGELQVNGEIIAYSGKTSARFGTGVAHSLIRGVRSLRSSHPTDSPVTVAGRRFEASRFSIFQDGRAMSVADACATLVTASGTPFQSTRVVDDQNSGYRVFTKLHGHSWVLDGTYDASLSLNFWTDGGSPPQSGIQVSATTTETTLYDLAGGTVIFRQPISIPSSGVFRCLVQTNTIYLWVNGRLAATYYVPGKISHRIGAISCTGGITRLIADELFEPAEGVVWSMQESARAVLQRLLEGRDAILRERSDGSVQVTLLEQRDNLGQLSGQYFVFYQRMTADEEWASAMVAWGAETWVAVLEPTADRLRWVQWQTPHIYDVTTLRHRAMRRLRKLWALKDMRVLRGPYDPRVEVGDQVSITGIRGVPAGRYVVRSIEVVGETSLLDMKVTVYAMPDDLVTATWPIKPGIDRPSEG